MGEAGLFVNPLDPREIAEAILKLHEEPDFRAGMIGKGLEFAGRFREYSYFGEILKIVEEFLAPVAWRGV
jgi:glycosyltransferase involved in cell wall biosynthesis